MTIIMGQYNGDNYQLTRFYENEIPGYIFKAILQLVKNENVIIRGGLSYVLLFERENYILKDIDLLPNVLVALIIRNGAQIVPKGDTVIMKNDNVIVSGPSLDKEFEGCLTEIRIDADNKWLGKSLSDIKFGPDKLVILIKRNEKVVIPTGSTVVMEDDVLIMNQA